MRILLSWLQDFVELPEYPEEVAEALTMAGMAVDAVNQEDGETVFELDITANRPDALNHFGIARELSAIYRRPLKTPAVDVSESGEPASSRASIEIADADLCSRYSGRVLLDVAVKPSPDWLRKRLELCGVRVINNIADLTNYVLLELGHPTHAFDLDLLEQSKIIVRRARDGEALQTLDGLDRKLSAEHLVIADGTRPVALAGVMGGVETEISGATRNVLLEAAWFQPRSIRQTARHFAMHTEASHRFERGADVGATTWALNRIAHLFAQAGSGAVLQGVIDVYPGAADRGRIRLRASRISRLLGAEAPNEEVERILEALGFAAEPIEGGWEVALPSHRLDAGREIDLIEEVARIYGYHRFSMTLPPAGAAIEEPPHAREEAEVRSVLRALGYDETISYAFISEEEASQFGSWEPVAIRNPVSEPWSVMRNTAVPSMLKALEWNLNRSESDVRLMEIGRLYRAQGDSYQEPAILAMGATGMARRPSLSDEGACYDFFVLKSDLLALLSGFDVREISFDATEVPAYYAANNSARLTLNGQAAGLLGELDPALAEARKIRQPVYIAEIFLDQLWRFGLKRPKHKTLPKVPAVHRDFSLFVPEGVSFSEIRATVGQQEHLTRLEPIEIFRGKQVPEGCYSLLLRAIWQKSSESMTDEEVNQYARRILASLSKTLGIQQRG